MITEYRTKESVPFCYHSAPSGGAYITLSPSDVREVEHRETEPRARYTTSNRSKMKDYNVQTIFASGRHSLPDRSDGQKWYCMIII